MKESNVKIIAEVGVNHGGSLEVAFELIRAAKQIGADVVKFQTFSAATLVSESADLADYQKNNTENKISSQYELLQGLELSQDDFKEIFEYCREEGIDFLSTGFAIDDIRFLMSLGMGSIKIPSGEITNFPYLRSIGELNLPTILSTGMSTLFEVENAVNTLYESGVEQDNLTILHCSSEYPVKEVDANLRCIGALKEKFGTKVGYSDHSEGNTLALAAVAMGASVIEKHLTLDKMSSGPDHLASTEPKEFGDLIRQIRHLEKALGNGDKFPSQTESRNAVLVRKSIIASRDIDAGELFSEDNLTTLRPATGLSPMSWKEIIGSKAVKSFKNGEQISV
jgi:N,N'-diacetyllegionaminate synthase